MLLKHTDLSCHELQYINAKTESNTLLDILKWAVIVCRCKDDEMIFNVWTRWSFQPKWFYDFEMKYNCDKGDAVAQ